MTVIKNARIVNEGAVVEGDLAMRDGRIERIGGVIAGAVEIDAAGAWLLPGMIDDQVHFREPGFEHKGTIATESAAALAGGVTSYMEMPNCVPQTIDARALDDKHRRAEAKSAANYAFYFGATNDNLEAIKAVDPLKACGVKVFMGASTGNMLVDDEKTLEGIFASSPLVIATHCEGYADDPRQRGAGARGVRRCDPHRNASPHSFRGKPATSRRVLAVQLATRHGSRLHVLHLTTARELELFESGPVEDKRITAEVCVHHLFFDETDYATRGADIKCNPAIKTPNDRRALRAAVADDRIDIVATDHAPHTREEKRERYIDAPSGMPLVQHALLTLLEHMPVERRSCRRRPMRRHSDSASSERGFLREGYWADLVLIDPRQTTVVDDASLLYKCGWSPFSGMTFASRVTHTFLNGHLVFAIGELQSPSRAMALEFDR